MNPAIDTCLHATTAVPPRSSVAEWWPRWRTGAARAPDTAAQALLGGFDADRVGWAFASGYQAALRALWPELPADAVAAFCVTEASGNRPRDIGTRFTPLADGSVSITGAKRWTTLGPDSSVLLIVGALPPADEGSRPQLKVARVDAGAPGLATAADARDALRARSAARPRATRCRARRCRRAAARRRLRALRQALSHHRGRPRHAGGAGLPAARGAAPRLARGLCRKALRRAGGPGRPGRVGSPMRPPRMSRWPARWLARTPCMPRRARCGTRRATIRRRGAGSAMRRFSPWPRRHAASVRRAPGNGCKAPRGPEMKRLCSGRRDLDVVADLLQPADEAERRSFGASATNEVGGTEVVQFEPLRSMW